jgi:hypothetical protein
MKSLRETLEKSIPEEDAFASAKSFGNPAIKQGTWLTTPLWNDYAWDLKLKDRGVSWAEFMEAYGSTKYAFIKWKRNEKSWEEAMNDLIEAIIQSR